MINHLSFKGENTNLNIDSTNNIKHLVFNSKSSGTSLILAGADIPKIDFIADSSSVNLSGKSIAKYLK